MRKKKVINRLDIESRVIRVECAKRGWGQRELARQAGMAYQYLRCFVSRGYCFSLGRLKIEAALDMPIFSNEQDFANRKLLAARFGFDLYLASRSRLRQLALETGLPGHWSRAGRQEILQAFIQSLPSA